MPSRGPCRWLIVIGALVCLAAVPASASARPHHSKVSLKKKTKPKKSTTVVVKCAAATPVICQGSKPGPQGPAGKNGTNGADGRNGTSATKLFAVVDGRSSNTVATIVHGSGAVSATHTGNGLYFVRFNQNITACAFEATLGTPNFSVTPEPLGMIAASGYAAGTDTVFVETTDTAGNDADRNFHLAVFC